MEAIILAGGFGTRLRPLTFTRAKSLLPILNKPMVSYIIEKLPPQVDKVILAVNYKKQQIESYLKEQDFNKEIIVNDEPKPLGTGGAVKFAEEHLTDSFFVLNADTICSSDLEEMIRYHTQKQAAASISLWPVENVSEFGVVDITDTGKITRFVEKPPQDAAPSNLINAGVYLLEPLVLDYIKTGRLVSMEKEIFPQIIQDTDRFYGFEFKGFWVDVGRITSYITVNMLLLNQHKIEVFKGKHCTIRGELQQAVLGDHITVDSASQIHSSVLLDDAYIGENVTLDRCVIGAGATIHDGAHLKDVVVGDNEEVEPNTTLENKMIWTQPIPEGYPKKQIGNVIGE